MWKNGNDDYLPGTQMGKTKIGVYRLEMTVSRKERKLSLLV